MPNREMLQMITAYNILHGPEFWLAVAIWGIGAACGVGASWAAIEIDSKAIEKEMADLKEEESNESMAPALDRPVKRRDRPARGGAHGGGTKWRLLGKRSRKQKGGKKQ